MYTLQKSSIISEIRATLRLGIPLAAAQLAQSLTAFVDTVMMGLLGSQIIAAGGLGAVTFAILLIVSSAIVSAVSPLVAEAYGANQTKMVECVVRQGLWLAIICGIPITVILFYGKTILLFFGQDASTVTLTEQYLQAIAPGFVPAIAFTVLRNFVAGVSQTRPIMVIVICGTFLNIIANYVLMFGKLGLPALGLAGIGWGSTLTFWCMLIAIVIYIKTEKTLKKYDVFSNLHQFNPKIFGELLHIGLPTGILSAVEAGLFTVTTFIMGMLGTVTLAAHQIALQTAATTFTVALGISFATTVRVGQEVGQKNVQASRLAGYVGISLGGLFMAFMGILFWLIPERIVSLYLDINDPTNAEVVTQAKALLKVAAFFQIVDGIQVNAVGALRGLKDTKIPMLIGIFAYWCIGFTSGYLLGLKLGFGGVGLWWGLAIGLAVASVILTWRFSVVEVK
ncbi:MATE family efflux transporter [[Phormidium ambiguum] IAM M-71]|uniref:Probable multidrug resistance protein NorM n=1 Tax=[Phormidium ambiguum] IAM M-71 TaxID=454136 RepID=A0A1U7IPU6_9CYAN|nr:MATE family efflux transporter [Phormidium ambiguum]OKH39436.1 MATE family efflux transporter [Phormidium ambiguum IAM M-71]